MTNSSIEYKIRRKKFFESKSNPDRSFKTLTAKRKPIKINRKKLLPDLTLYPKDWTYLVSNEKHPHTITLKQFRKKKLNDGDKIYFERGQIYNFAEYNVTVDNVTFGSYGSGVDPIFLGSDDFGSATWTSETGGYYSTPLATAPLWVTINGECARQGETDWIVSTAVATSTTITGDATTLNAFNSVEALANNAKLRHKEFNFRLSYEHLVTGYNTGTGVLTIGAGGVALAAAGLPFKLYGQKQYATLEGDWWYDDTNNELWIKTASTPSGTDIRVITENYAFNVQATSVTIENIDFTQYFESAIEAPDAPSLTLTGLTIYDNRQNGLLLYGNNTTLTLSNFTIQRCGLQGIHLGAVSASTISDYTIHDIGLQDNIGWPVDTYWIKTGGCAIAYFWDSAETRTTALNVDITGGEMYNLGYMGMLMVGDNHDITECVAHDFGLKWNDGGGFYTIHRTSLGASTKNITFTRCHAYNGYGGIDGIGGTAITLRHASGFYVDNGSELITVDECVSYNNTDFGILSNWDTQKTIVTDSIVFGNGNTQVCYRQHDEVSASPVFLHNTGNVLTGNTIVAADVSYAVEAIDFNGDATYNPFDTGSSDNNSYVRPYASSTFPVTTQTINARRTSSTGAQTAYNLAAWQTQMSDDVSSTERYETGLIYRGPVHNHANTVRIEANPTGSAVVFDATGYFSITGAALGATENIPAWGALVYIAHSQTNPDQLYDLFTAANGTAIAGRAPTVGPIPTVASGTHSILNNELVSTVNGSLFWGIAQSDIDFTIKTRGAISNGLVTYFRWVDNSNRFVISVTSTSITLFEFDNSASATNTWTVPNGVSFTDSLPFYYFTVRAIGNALKLWVDGRLVFDVTVGHIDAGAVGLLGHTGRQSGEVSSNTP